MRIRLSAAELREIVRDEITSNIALHRESRIHADSNYVAPEGEPTDQEITDFIRSNQLLDFETINFLTSPSILGFEARIDSVRAEWLEEFRSHVEDWSESETWLGADLIDIIDLVEPELTESVIWQPNIDQTQPSWIEKSPTALLIAAELLKKGRLLSELNWRDFEKLIAILLEREGWNIQLTRGSKDGGIDVIATIENPEIGLIKSLWQAKKYGIKNKVQIRAVRELSAIIDSQKATKGIIVTTSHLTKGAIDWIRQDQYRLDFKDKSDIERWVLESI
ncbi:MAG: hypothetical protein CV087_23545 [Candidatus Brocadia sp. WS118]|nr:MAG: hypothetical protein CV087_23545 [Candidatus Brocadia sp. WS118]